MKFGAMVQTTTEFAPLVVFFAAGQIFSFEGAVIALLVATVVSIVVAWVCQRHIPIMPLASGVLVIITGVLTVYFNLPDAIIIADTIWFWGLAALILVGIKRGDHVLEKMFDRTFAMTAAGWTKLSWRWFFVLVVAGIANEYVRLTMSPEFWIDYRFTKILIIMLFSVYQFTLAREYRIAAEANGWGLRIKG